ncbi:hypothetical protein CJF31_00007710 [Rutstroemia sp. NJR-2017a BVV2]|nr:hypothetical protein CJF31_00008679 [Rutstroemia sp. NJR-2017a BVV2]PQE21858.1 hypothetical protein CJF31_00007710 [Rutstroemia sp. NJR-2017a BVV2]
MLLSRRAIPRSGTCSTIKYLARTKDCSSQLYRSRERITPHVTMDGGSNGYHGHDTHALPPQAICDAYKKYQRMSDADVNTDLEIVDFNRGLSPEQKEKLHPVGVVPSELIAQAQREFKNSTSEDDSSLPEPCTIYEHSGFPGLRILPGLLPPECQTLFLSRLLHRELANPLHKTNLHDDYEIPFPPPDSSFFTYPQSAKNQVFVPRNPDSKHKPLNAAQVLQKKLRWLTLGSQYDWNTRAYPSTSPTPFPADISKLVTSLFQNAFTPESGVVLLYSMKDFMPVHRDVSEECERGLASFTLGCDGLFVISRDVNPGEEDKDDREQDLVCIRVRSGDVIQMGGETRWAWHAMPKIIGGTCPPCLAEWPVGSGEGGKEPKEYERWRGYMRGKRLNISCRQVWN